MYNSPHRWRIYKQQYNKKEMLVVMCLFKKGVEEYIEQIIDQGRKR